MNDLDIKPILESLFFVSDSPIRLEVLVEILPESSKEAILEGIRRIQEEYGDPSKGIELTEIAGGYQFRTKPGWGEWVNRLKKTKAVKLSQAALETLAIVAYRQPVIRPAIEEIRGVDSGSVLHTLMERGLIKMMGRKDLPGRPIVYGTSKAFLELFSLNSLSDLPRLQEIQPPPAPEEASPQEVSSREISPQETSLQETSGEESLTTGTEEVTSDESSIQSPLPPTGEGQGEGGQNEEASPQEISSQAMSSREADNEQIPKAETEEIAPDQDPLMDKGEG